MKGDPFDDLDSLRLTPEAVAGHEPGRRRQAGQAEPRRARNRDFVMVPMAWVDRLKGSRRLGHLLRGDPHLASGLENQREARPRFQQSTQGGGRVALEQVAGTAGAGSTRPDPS